MGVGTGCSSCRLTDAASQADARALMLASLSTDLTLTMNAVVTRCAPKIRAHVPMAVCFFSTTA
jgi:hypothetical protein